MVHACTMDTFGLLLFLGYDISGQLAVLFVAVSSCNSVPDLLNAIDKYQEAGFTQTPQVVLSNSPEVFEAFRSKYEDKPASQGRISF